MIPTGKRFVIGARAYFEKATGDWRVVCATCGGGGSVKHPTQESAGQAAARDSDKRCSICGVK